MLASTIIQDVRSSWYFDGSYCRQNTLHIIQLFLEDIHMNWTNHLHPMSEHPSLTANIIQSLRLLQAHNIMSMISISLARSISSYQQQISAQPPTPKPCPPKAHTNPKVLIQISSDSQEEHSGKQKSILSISNGSTSPNQSIQEVTQIDYQTARQVKNKVNPLDRFTVVIPELDEIETCNIPPLGLKKEEVERKRTSLLQRQVFQWIYVTKKCKKKSSFV